MARGVSTRRDFLRQSGPRVVSRRNKRRRPISFSRPGRRSTEIEPMNLSLQDPLFATYAIAATLMILKAISMSWLTVARMLAVNGGFRSPEDIRKTPLNREPDPRQLA